MLNLFRTQKKPVIHVRHKAKNGFDIHKNVKPIDGEKIITKEEVNSFNGTDLLEHLKTKNISRLVIIGMQTHMCLEAAVRSAYDYGFECVVVQDACAARDLTINSKTIRAEEVHASTLATLKFGGYSKVIDLKDFIENADMYMNDSFD